MEHERHDSCHVAAGLSGLGSSMCIGTFRGHRNLGSMDRVLGSAQVGFASQTNVCDDSGQLFLEVHDFYIWISGFLLDFHF